MTRALLHVLHVGAWALCYGATTFIYFRFNRRMQDFARSDEEHERLERAAAAGLQPWTAATVGVAALTGVALVFTGPQRSTAGWALLSAKATLWLAMVGVLAYAGRVLWPRRMAAPPDAWPRQRRRLFLAAFVLGFLLLCQLILGVAAHAGASHAAL